MHGKNLTLMKPCIIFIVCLLLSAIRLPAQDKAGRVKAIIGESLEKVLPDDAVFMYPQFIEGSVLYNDGKSGQAPLNIYLPTSSLWFIDPHKDTLMLARQNDIKMATLARDIYIRYNGSFIRILKSHNGKMFGIQISVKLLEPAKKGAYGGEDHTSSIDMLSSFSLDGARYRLSTLRGISYTVSYLPIIGKDDRLMIASRRNFNRVFPEYKAQIEEYVKKERLNFSDTEAVMGLYSYLETLDKP